MHACTMKVWPYAGGGQCQWYYPAADAFVDQRCDDFAFEGVSSRSSFARSDIVTDLPGFEHRSVV